MATISVSPKARSELSLLKEQFGFPNENDLAVFAMAYAIANKLPTVSVTGKKTKWSTGSFNINELEDVFSLFYPDVELNEQNMISLMEDLIHTGVSHLAQIVKENKYVRLPDLLPISD